jgi:hypothetical protein
MTILRWSPVSCLSLDTFMAYSLLAVSLSLSLLQNPLSLVLSLLLLLFTFVVSALTLAQTKIDDFYDERMGKNQSIDR